MKNNFVLPLALVLALAGCSKPAAEKPADAADKADAKPGVTMDAETQARLGLKIEPPAATQWQPELKVSGRVLDPAPLMDLLLELGRAQMTFDASHAELERAKQLKKDGNISERAFQDAETTYKQNFMAIAAIRYKLEATWGKQIARVMEPDVVPPGTRRKPDPFMENFPESTRLIRADLPTGERARYFGVAKVYSLSDKTSPVVAAQLDKLPALDPQTQQQSVLFSAERSPTNLLVPSEAVTLSLINSDMPEDGVIVPASAILRHEGAAWAYVQMQTNQFSRVEISLDCPADGGWFVKEKISTNSRVVIEGAQALLSAEFSTGAGGHEH